MKVFKLLRVAQGSLFKNKTRSLLTMLGVVIGVAAVVVMVAVGKGAQENIETRIQSLGTNLLMIRSADNRMSGVSRGAGSSRTLTLDDAEAIREKAALVMAVSPSVTLNSQVIGAGNNWFTRVEGIMPDFHQIRSWQIADGAMFTERDLRSRAKVAVLGATVAENLFPGQSAVGQRIRIRNVPFQVIGVLAEKGQSSRGDDQDDTIQLPVTTALYRLAGDRIYVNMIYASAYSPETIVAAQEEIREILRQTHALVEGQEDDFSIRNQTEITEAFSSTTRALTTLLGAIAGVSLFVGGSAS